MISALTVTFGPCLPMADSPSRDRIPPRPDPPVEAESSLTLIRLARAGSEAARNELCARYLPRLQRWAQGRLPASARGALDTVDLVQDTFIQVLRRLDDFDPRHSGALQGYLRRTLMNKIRDELRRVQRRGTADPLDSARPSSDPSPLQAAIGEETVQRYEAALERLKESDRDAIVMHVELGCSNAEIMEALDKPSLAAAHMTVTRALVRLAKEMSRERP